MRRRELRRCALADNDLFAQLRQRGAFSVDGLRYVPYEVKGSITVVPADPPATPSSCAPASTDAAGYP